VSRGRDVIRLGSLRYLGHREKYGNPEPIAITPLC
jgi:hypothetical protein